MAVVAAIAYFVVSSRAAPPPAASASPAVNAAVVSRVTSIPPEVFDAVGGGGLAQSVKVAPGTTVLKGASGEPLLIYVGAEYCPYCASERWSLVIALSRFGAWSGLALSRSSSTDVFPNTPTFTFRDAHYTSDLVELSAVETSDRQQKPLRNPDATQQRSMDRFDPDGSIPFISIADRYYVNGAGYSPDVLAGKSWDDVATALRDPSSTVAKAVIGNADRLTAAICAVTGQKPADVCTSASVKGLLPAR